MKHLLSILFLFPIPTTYLPTATGPTTPTGQPTATPLFTTEVQSPKASPSSDTVYILDSPTSYAYHKTLQCQYLKNPKHKVLKVPLSKADSLGRRPCKVCYKQYSTQPKK